MFFFFNDTATTQIYTLSLHDALPILNNAQEALALLKEKRPNVRLTARQQAALGKLAQEIQRERSEEHTSELQSLRHLVCRLLLEKKKQHQTQHTPRAHHTQHISRTGA